MSKKINDYQLGDKLYRYVRGGGMFSYLVTGIRIYDATSVQLEVESQSCSHGWKCSLLIGQNDYGKIFHIHMLNDDDCDSQRHWHTNDGLHFWPTEKEALNELHKILISEGEKEIRNLEERLVQERKRLDELRALLERGE